MHLQQIQFNVIRSGLIQGVVVYMLCACSLAPTQPMEPMAVPPAWRQAGTTPGWVSADAARVWSAGQWWKLFGDPVINSLMEQVNLNNQNLKLVAANVAQAQALLRQQRAQALPQIGLQLNQQRIGGDDRSTANFASLNFNASWAPDLWGRIGNAVDAQSANVQASQADLAAARLNAQASLAQAYFALRETDAEQALMTTIIKGYERSVKITQNRYEVGVVARTDALQAQATLRNARSSLVALQRSRSQYEHTIALLVGQVPANFEVRRAEWVSTVPNIPTEVPSLLLLRRPDIASAERAVTAANFQIGVARSAYFPELSLRAAIGATASDVGQLFSAPNLLWSLGVGLAQTLFDSGARDAKVAQAQVAHTAAVARYKQTALTALNEVESQLTAIHTLTEQTEHVRTVAEIAAKVEQQMLNRYDSGLVSYTEVVTAQASALSAQRSLLQLQLQRQQAAVALIQSLGGGWQVDWQ